MGYKYLNQIISRLKGETFSIDHKIPGTYLSNYFLSKIVSLIWGTIRFRSIRKRVFLHPNSTIRCKKMIHHGSNLTISRNCYIDALSEKGLVLGNNVSMGINTYIALTGSMKYLGKGMKIGNNVGLGSFGHYGSGAGYLEIGDDCIFGPHVTVVPENHNYDDNTIPIRCQGVSSVGGVRIGTNCWIGANVTILDGAHIGNRCIVAAGAVVKGEFPDNVIIGGVPAKILKNI